MPLRKTLDVCTYVAEQDTASTVMVEQFADQPTGEVGIGRFPKHINAVLTDVIGNLVEQGTIFFDVARRQTLDQAADRCVLPFLLDKAIQVCVSVRIEQGEAGKMAGDTQLFRGCGQEQQCLDALGEPRYSKVRGTCALRAPVEMVCLVDDEEIPARVDCLIETPLVGRQQAERRDDEL